MLVYLFVRCQFERRLRHPRHASQRPFYQTLKCQQEEFGFFCKSKPEMIIFT